MEVTAEEAPTLIHMQNYAEHIRVLKANVGHANSFGDAAESAESKEETVEQEEPIEEPASEQPDETTEVDGNEGTTAETEGSSDQESDDSSE